MTKRPAPVCSPSRSLLCLLPLALALLMPGPARAAPRAERPARAAPGGTDALPAGARTDVAIPDVLRPWVGWVLHDKQRELCPFLAGEGGSEHGPGTCTWPARLSLSLRERGGTFTQTWRVYTRALVSLPGDTKVWPQDVRVDGKPAVVMDPSGDDDAEDDAGEGVPQVLLLPGDHTISGSFVWDELPESLLVPKRTGLVALTVRGTAIPSPSRDEEGRLFLQKEDGDEVEEDVLEVTVHRKITDGVPLTVTTRLSLRVSGKSREVVLGPTLPSGFVPMSLTSPLPARLEPDSRLRVQVRPGSHTIELLARHDGPVTQLSRPKDGGPLWPASEVWVFEAQPRLRVVTVDGVASIDPQQTTLPDGWKTLPAYPMTAGDTLRIKEQRRGEQDPPPDQLRLRRQLWLDFDGGGLTVRDRIAGELNRSWRLEVNRPTELGHVSASGQDLLITRSPSPSGAAPMARPAAGDPKTDRAGVEIRQGRVRLAADSRIPLHGEKELPAVSWDADFQQVAATLHLPPGWRLLHASGADEVPATWLHKWSLMHLFLVLIVTMAVARLYGRPWGALALAALVLTVPETDAPRFVWLLVLLPEALWRVLPDGRLLAVTWVLRGASRVALVIALVTFGAQQLRNGLHPAIEDKHGGGFQFSESSWLSEATDSDESEEEQVVTKNKIYAVRQSANTDIKIAKEEAKSPDTSSIFNNVGDATGKSDDAEVGEGYGGGGYGNAAPRGKLMKKSGRLFSQQMQQRNTAYEFDPNAVVQTGPGLPRWQWTQAELRWSGPVLRDQMLRLYLLSPGWTLALSVVQVLLLGWLALRLCGLGGRRRDERGPGAGANPGAGAGPASAPLAVAAALALLCLSAGTARAELPSTEVLDTLRERLLQPPECRPNCASSPRLELTVLPKVLRARMQVGAAAPTAVPLPGNAGQWLPERVLVDGADAKALLRSEDGNLWLALSEGSHQLVLEGALPSRETVQIALPLKPHHVTAAVSGWRLEGLHEDGLADDLQLTRASENRGEGSAALLAGTLPPLVTVERTVQLGLIWQVDTLVRRTTPTGSAVVLEVPLLPGESVTTPDVRVQGGKAFINMAPSATEVSWHSLLHERSQLDLVASKVTSFLELWRLTVSPIWHVELSGIPTVSRLDAEGLRQPEWQPWPGESVHIAVSRPAGVAGRSLTIDHSSLRLRPGLRTTDASLSLSLRSSRGGPHPLKLPEGAELLDVVVGGKSQPLRLSGQRLELPLVPGMQSVTVQWRQPAGIQAMFRSFEVDLGAPAVNVELCIELGTGRWVLFTGGPLLGPAVLFWGLLLVYALVAVVLGRFRLTPLRTHHWLLLSVGLTQVSVVAAALVFGWLLALGLRGRDARERHWAVFDLRQIGLALWTLTALGILVYAIRDGLLGPPDMQIAGNGSSSASLRWFADRVPGDAAAGTFLVPRAWVLSVPLLAYRAVMLLWALWLASALLGWLRWAYQAISANGLWRRSPPRPEKEAKKAKDKAKKARRAAEDAEDAADDAAEEADEAKADANDDAKAEAKEDAKADAQPGQASAKTDPPPSGSGSAV